MAIWVSGNPGSGKSSLTVELLRRGVRAVDSDEVHGLAAWMDASGAVVGDSSLPPTPDLLARCYWGWSVSCLDDVVSDLGPRGVLLGIAANQWDFVDRFDALVLLELDAATQRERVASRHPLLQEEINAGLPTFQAQMLHHGAVRIDAALPTPVIADEVIALLDQHG